MSGWERIGENTGSRTGYWLRDLSTPERRRALVKLPKRYSTHVCGEVWAECIAAKIGRVIGLSVPEVEIVQYKGEIAVLIWDFLSAGEELREGSALSDTLRSGRRLTFSEVRASLTEYLGDTEAALFIVRLVCFDTLIANYDRHQENWGVIISQGTPVTVRPAPYYDNGSAFGSNLGVEKLRHHLDDGLKQFDTNFRYEIGLSADSRPYLDQILEKMQSWDQMLGEFHTKLLELTDARIDTIVSEVADAVISEDQRRFVSTLLKHRRDLIMGRAY